MTVLCAQPGLLAMTVAPGSPMPDLRAAGLVLGDTRAGSPAPGCVILRSALPDPAVAGDGSQVDLLCRDPRRRDRRLDADDVAALLGGGDRFALRETLPPFAAAVTSPAGRIVLAADLLGYRHLYHRIGPHWAAVSTSARALAALDPVGVDRGAMALQALLGWQVGLRTPFLGVSKVAPGATVVLEAGRLEVELAEPPQPPGRGLALGAAVEVAAGLLRDAVEAVLDDYPDAVLQLTGGQDSRVLLGAVPPGRRRGLSVMTLSSPGNPDAAIAADLARRYGMNHEIVDLAGLEALDPYTAHDLAVRAAARLDCSANPIALASVAWAEAQLPQRPRIAGLGGEVSRGFYYIGPYRRIPVTATRVRRLAEWRMLTNEGVAPVALGPRFAAEAKSSALAQLVTSFDRTVDWFSATDEFYLWQRMHRWTGVVGSANVMDRVTINPMLDDRFLEVARGLDPRAKQNSLFLSRLSCALDDELSTLPLDGRPAPAVYANPTAVNRARRAGSTGIKIVNKVRQRWDRTGRPAAGAATLAPLVTAWYRDTPAALDGVRRLDLLDPRWLDQVLDGRVEPDAASAAMLVTLEVAADALQLGALDPTGT